MVVLLHNGEKLCRNRYKSLKEVNYETVWKINDSQCLL